MFVKDLFGEVEDLEDVVAKGGVAKRSLFAEIEAIIFATREPIKITEIMDILQDDRVTSKEVVHVIESLIQAYQEKGGGIALVQAGGAFQFRTTEQVSHLMERMFSQRPRPLSRAAQETLAIVAYRQPVTRADIEFIRGVDAGSILKNLLDRGMVKSLGRKEDSGRPILFGTTEEFLQIYKLASLEDLPPIESFQPEKDVIKGALSKIDAHQDEVDEFIDQAVSERHTDQESEET